MKTWMGILGHSIPTPRKAAVLAVATTALFLLAFSAQAQLVQNGGFGSTTNGLGQIPTGSGPAGAGVTAVTDWTTGGYNFVLNASTKFSGVTSQYGTDDVSFWTTGNGGTGTITANPNGGNFLALDGDYNVGTISQPITALTPTPPPLRTHTGTANAVPCLTCFYSENGTFETCEVGDLCGIPIVRPNGCYSLAGSASLKLISSDPAMLVAIDSKLRARGERRSPANCDLISMKL
jgi:hypothetical protein